MTHEAIQPSAADTGWNGPAAAIWAQAQDRIDRQLAPLGEAAMTALAVEMGDKVLDIGCGGGATALDLAWHCGRHGEVVGVDISARLLALACDRAEAADLPQVRFVEADAQRHSFEPATYDAIFSRFGVMFFDDPVAAFRNLRKALKPGGRMAFVCWRAAAENQYVAIPAAAAFQHLPGKLSGAEGPGQFAFADPAHVRTILGDAGFQAITITPVDDMLGGESVEETVEMLTKLGPLRDALAAAPKGGRRAAVEAVRAALVPFDGPSGVRMACAAWLVTARN